MSPEDENVPVLLTLERLRRENVRELPPLAARLTQLFLEVRPLELLLVAAHEASRQDRGPVFVHRFLPRRCRGSSGTLQPLPWKRQQACRRNSVVREIEVSADPLEHCAVDPVAEPVDLGLQGIHVTL